MPNRREFLQAGFAASIVPVAFSVRAELSASEAQVSAPACHRLASVVCDVRSRHSTAMADEIERLGVGVVRTNGDITDYWAGDLSRMWKTAPVPIGGLTAHGPLFCLERLGWDYGLRVVFRAEHRFRDGHLEHLLTGPARTLADSRRVLAAAEWPARIAHLLNSCIVTTEIASTAVRADAGGEPWRDIDETLFSWVIAPKLADTAATRRA